MQRSRCTPRVGGLALVLLLLAACAAGSAHAASLGLRGGSLKIARPNPDIYANYTFQSSRDTFDLCKEQSGLRREVPLEELLPQFGLPADLTQRKTITLAQFLEMCAAAAPAATLVVAPMLHGDTDLHASLSEGLPKLVHFTVRNKDALVPHQVGGRSGCRECLLIIEVLLLCRQASRLGAWAPLHRACHAPTPHHPCAPHLAAGGVDRQLGGQEPRLLGHAVG